MKKALFVFVVGLFLSVHAQAQSEIYGGASIGGSYYADYTGSLASVVATSVAIANPGIPITAYATQNRNDFGAKLFGGSWFTENLGAEIGYAYLGEITGNVTTSGVATSWSVKQQNKAAYIDALIGARLDNKSRIYLKIGGYHAWTDLSASVTGPGGTAAAGVSGTNTGFHYGVGFDYPLSDKMNIRVEGEGFNKVGSSTTGQGSIGLFTLGLLYKF